MERNFASQHTGPVVDHPFPHKSGREAAFALTKGALCIVVMASSLALWAAVWAAAGSFASAWLQ